MPILRLLCCCLFPLLLADCAVAQSGPAAPATAVELSKKEGKLFAAAKAAYDRRDLTEATDLIDQLLARQPRYAPAYYYRTLVAKDRGDLPAAIDYLKRGVAVDPAPRAVNERELGDLLAKNNQYAEALAAYERYLATDYVRAKPERLTRAQELVDRARTASDLAASPVDFRAEPLPGGVNTPQHLEYFPTVDISGRRMVFTRRVNGEQEDFYVSELGEDGQWSAARPLPGVNTQTYNEGAQSLTADGNYLVFTACDRPDGLGGCDLYFSERDAAGNWSGVRNLGEPVNSRFPDKQPSLSADGSLLFFNSSRPGGVGGEDLYVSGRLTDGSWSRPVNLGATINTKGNDNFPFWAADGKTLFFTSNGHPGLGGADIFRSELGGDNRWATPVNLGYPINTAAEETNLFVARDGNTAYFSKGERSADGKLADVDIYRFFLPEHLRPTATTYLAATVRDARTKAPLRATVRLRATDATAPSRSRRTDTEGKFVSLLPVGSDWALTVDHPGYLFFTTRFRLSEGFTQENPYELTIDLQPVTEDPPVDDSRAEADGAIAFRNVLFDSGSADLLPVSADELDRLAETLTAAPAFSVEIVGHTDDVGKPADNQQLSEARAVAVRTYLIGKGVAAGRITTAGRGESQPVTGNDTAAGRAANRRVTFRLFRP